MARVVLVALTVVLLMLVPWTSTQTYFQPEEFKHTYHEIDKFNQSGFYQDNIYTSADGESHISRPDIVWNTPFYGLTTARTGACSVAIESLEEVWLIGGRMDPNPSQSGDEVAADLIEKMDNANKSWMPAQTNMPTPQQYCEAEVIGDSIYVIGDWNRGSNPYEVPSGRVQIYNITTETWTNGTSMPADNERGLGSMAQFAGKLYYAGGVRNANANDATNSTYEYNPQNDTWTRMANMTQARASFELINFHGKLYAIGGFQGTQTWNRQGLSYVESYDVANDTWTNLSSLPVGIFGWAGTVLNDEIVLIGGFNGGTKKTVYHYNPIENTWRQDANSISSGHFDLIAEELNGSIVWASGEKSSYPYYSWGQTFSDENGYQNSSSSHTGLITSPVIDLRPNPNSNANLAQFTLLGNNTFGGDINFQYRYGVDSNSVTSSVWKGVDGSINSTYPIGITDIDLDTNSNFVQYRIMMTVYDMENWDEPDLDIMQIRADHAGFHSSLPEIIHPRAETVNIQTTHDLLTDGNYSLSVASCMNSGAVIGPWSNIHFENNTSSLADTQGLFSSGQGTISSSLNGETIINWSLNFGDLTGISYLCFKSVSEGSRVTQYLHPNPIPVDRILEVRIANLGGLSNGDAVTGGFAISVGIDHEFISSGIKLSSGSLQTRLTFSIREVEMGANNYSGYTNLTTPWTELNIANTTEITWILPSNISGEVSINMEARSDHPLQIISNNSSSHLVLDNMNPQLVNTIPQDNSYIDSRISRHISVTIADNSGFDHENLSMLIWVEGLDDGSNSMPLDGIPQNTEYRVINFTLENTGNFWWFNTTQSDDSNEDREFVHFKILGMDKVGNPVMNDTISYQTRDAKNSVVKQIYNIGQSDLWEVSRNIHYEFEISDDNGISDLISMTIELGGDSDFGVKYNVADSTCSVLDSRVDSGEISCNHRIQNDNMMISVILVANWNIDITTLTEGHIDVILEDKDGISKTSFQNLWNFSNDFDLEIFELKDDTAPKSSEITNQSILRIGDKIRLIGMLNHSVSGVAYDGPISMTWAGTLQGENWFGGGSLEVENGVINTTIIMPNSGGLMDFTISFMDPLNINKISSFDVPIFIVDDAAPIIMPPNIGTLSRYHLENVDISVKIEENVAWNGLLNLTCQVISTEVEWQPVTISMIPQQLFQGKTLFSYKFDFSELGDPSLLSPEAKLDCWASGSDDAGFELVDPSLIIENTPWLSTTLSNDGPNIELVHVDTNGKIEAGKDIRVEISIQNSGESLQDSFNVSVYTISNGERTLVSRYNQAQIASGQGIVKRVLVKVPQGDWELEVVVDEEQNIWELNENDNTYSKTYTEHVDEKYSIYLISAISFFALAVIGLLRRQRNTKLKKGLEDEKRIVFDNQKEAKQKPSKKPRKGPPPKKSDNAETNLDKIGLNSAIEKLESINGSEQGVLKVDSYHNLPGGGEYIYSTEQTLYTGKGIGKWRLENDGSFTKIG